MDSITQAALGAVVAHACWHRSLGRPALLWGAVLGTLPDLDVIVTPWLDLPGFLRWHRGESHSLWFMVLAAWLCVAPLRFVHRRANPPPTRREIFLGAWLVFASHVLIDVFTVYGTQLLAPFSRYGFGLNNLFIIDPLFTLPLLLGALLALVAPSANVRRLASVTALALCTLYTVWSFVAQARAHHVFRAELARQGHVATRSFTAAAPLNTLLWRHVAEVEDGFLIGYWSWLDDEPRVRFTPVPQRAEAVAGLRPTRAFETVDWFAQGYWAALPGDTPVVVDLRFAELRPAPDTPPSAWSWPFAWSFGIEDGETVLQRHETAAVDRAAAMERLWRRIRGDYTVW